MKTECQHCHRQLQVNIQFILKDSIEIECPECHELTEIEGDSGLIKQELGDTHPILVVSDPQNKTANADLTHKSIVVDDIKPKIYQFRKPQNRWSWSILQIIFILICVLMLAAYIFWSGKKVSSQSTVKIKNTTDKPESVLLSPDHSSKVLSKHKNIIGSKISNGISKPTLDSDDHFLKSSEVLELYETFSPRGLEHVKKQMLDLLDLKSPPARTYGMKIACLLSYMAYREQDEKLASKAQEFADRYSAQLEDFDFNLFNAIQKMFRKDFAQTYRFSNNALSINAGHLLAQSVMHYAHFQLNQSSFGLSELQKLYKNYQYYPSGFFLFEIFLQRKTMENIIKTGNALLAQEPDDHVVQYRFGQSLLSARYFSDAELIFSQLYQRFPNDWRYRVLLSETSRKLEKFQSARNALVYLLQSTDLKLSNEAVKKIQIERGLIDYDEGLFEKSTQYFEVAHRLNPLDEEATLLLSDSLIQSGRIQTAEKVLERARSEIPKSQEILRKLFWVYIKQRNQNSAEKTAREIDVLNASDVRMYFELGKLMESKSKLSQALAAYQKAYAMDTGSEDVRKKVEEVTNQLQSRPQKSK
ncbi:MAG: hypothetical protein KDD48_02360 [Bdellovibrionales bacterium]|nr:hypothetical protein [Bdellovibrionales bacterium]